MQYISLLVKTAKNFLKPEEEQPLNKSRYTLVDTLSNNGATTIYHCQLRLSHADVCLKVFNNRKCKKADRESLEREVLNEIEILRRVNHPCLLGSTNIFLTQRRAVIEMDYMRGGDLYDYVSTHGALCEHAARTVMAQVFSGLHFLHESNIVHRDIKLDNILIENPETLRVRISDFGLALSLDETPRPTEFVGTTYYIAPELYRKQPYGPKVDVWAAGIVLYALLFVSFPFTGEGSELVASILRGKVTVPASVSPVCRDFIESALRQSVDRRLDSADALIHPFLEDMVILSESVHQTQEQLCYCHSDSLLSKSRLTNEGSSSSL